MSYSSLLRIRIIVVTMARPCDAGEFQHNAALLLCSRWFLLVVFGRRVWDFEAACLRLQHGLVHAVTWYTRLPHMEIQLYHRENHAVLQEDIDVLRGLLVKQNQQNTRLAEEEHDEDEPQTILLLM